MARTPQVPYIRDVNGIDMPILPILVDLPFIPGNIWHVKPYSGSDMNNSGKNPESAFKTLVRAKEAATANQNDVVLFYGEGNAAARCSDYQSSQLDWNKDLVHLIGVNSGVRMSQRGRITSVSTYANAAPIFKLSANGCLIKNLQIFLGVTDTTPLGAVEVTGQRNRFKGCHLYGMGNTANDIAGAYSLKLNGAEENEFEDCVIGSDRAILGAAENSQILTASHATNNRFRNCEIRLYTAHATNSVFLRCPANSLNGALAFFNCQGINTVQGSDIRAAGTELTYAMVVNASAGGGVFLDPETIFQAADVNSTDSGNVYGNGAAAGIAIPLLK